MTDSGVEVLLQRRSHRWCIVIEEAIATDLQTDVWANAIIWTTATLANHPAASRAAYHMWYFDSKLEAEKFITLFWLKWA